MQRSVAISGPTPAMIGWTVIRDCGLRRLGGKRPADDASRQLRGLVTWSRAVNEGRLFEGWCFHPGCDALVPAADWLGFPCEEPLIALGGEAAVRQACGNCLANLDRDSGGAGGCWGWLPYDLEPDRLEASRRTGHSGGILTLESGESFQVLDANRWLNGILAVPAAREAFRPLFSPTQPPWPGLWIGSEWSREQCSWWVTWGVPASRENTAGSELVRLGAAVQAALVTGSRFVFERVPPGHATGQTWHWPAHCGRCGQVRAMNGACSCCGERRGAVAASQRRVMGLRPWLNMSRLMPADQLDQLAGRYLAYRKQAEQ